MNSLISRSDWIDFRSGGLVFYGGFIGAALAVILYTRIHGSQPLWKIADAFARVFPWPRVVAWLPHVRLLFRGDLRPAVVSRRTVPPSMCLAKAPDDPAHSVHVHPSQVYAALLNFALYGGLA